MPETSFFDDSSFTLSAKEGSTSTFREESADNSTMTLITVNRSCARLWPSLCLFSCPVDHAAQTCSSSARN